MQFPTEVPIGGYPSSSDGSTNNQLQQRRRPDLSSPASLLNPGPLQPGYQQPSTPTSPAVASVNRNDSNTSSTKEITADQFIRKQIQNIRTELNLLISIPFLLLVGYGGRPALLILSFGSIACYVLDILEAVEGTIIAFFLTMIMFLGALIYATSDALQESFYNIILLPTFIITIIIFFIVGISHFNVALNESSILMNVMIQITFAVSPVLFGSLVSAILCDDILDFDLQTCFTFLYFLYTWYYCRPRYLYRLQYKKVGSKITAPYSDMKRQLMIPSIVMPIIYLMPIIISFLLQLSLHHNVLTSERHRIIGITQSILLPALLMCFTYQQHENQAQQLLKDSTLPGGGKKEGGDVVRNEDMKIVVKWVFRLLLALYIILSVESHPFFDEMKHFAHVTASSASSSSGAYASSIENLLFTAVIFFLFIIYLLMEKIHEYQSNDIHSSLSSDYDDISPYNTSKQLPDLLKEGFGVKTRFQLYNLILRLALDGSIGCLVGLVAYLFNFPRSVIPIAVIGSVAMMELHFFHDTSAVFSRFLLALLAITSTSLTMITFTKGTVYYLLYSFHSYFYGSFQLSQFSWLVTILMSSAIILPVFLRSNQKKGKGSSGKDAPYETFSLSDNPRSNSDDVRAKGIDEDDEVYGDPTSSFFSAIFSTGLIVFMLIVTWLELTMMEQDWSGLEVTSEIVYPTYFFILTMVLSGWIGFMLYSHRSIGFTTLGNIAIIQATKLLHFFYHSSYIIIPASILLISNLLPFFRQYSYYQRYVVKYQQSSFDDLGNTRQQKKNNTTSPFISWNEVVVYVITNAIIYQVFSANLSRWFLRQLFSFFNNTFTTSTDEEVVVVGSRQISRWQVLFFSLALFIMYVSSILFVFQKKQKFIRSILMGVSILLVMISFEGFGLLRLNDVTDDPVVLTANSVNGHFLSAYDHSTFFMLMTIVMTLIAWSRLIALDSMLTCLFYSLIFGFISTKAMINWAFPYHSLVTHPYYDQHHHHHHHHTTSSSSQQVYYYPFCFLYVLKVLNTFIALWNPKNSSHSVSFTTLFPLIYLVTLLWPLVNLIISLVLLENQDVSEVLADLRDREEIGASAGRESDIGTTLITNKMTIYTGIILSTLIGHLTLTASFRLKEVLNYMRDPRETIYSSRIVISFLFSNSSQGSSGGYPLVLFHAFVTIAWGVLVILFGMTSIDYDIFFPVVSAILLLYDSEIEVERIPFFASCFKYLLTKKRKVSPWQLWTLINVSFWLISFIYHVFVMDFPLTSTTSSLDIDSSYYKHLLYLTRIKPYSWLNFDSNVSIWSSESVLTPVLNVTYLLFTLPAIYYAIWNASTYAVNKTNQYTTQMTGLVSDEVMFLLSVLTLVPLIGANVDCLRYLALIGGLHGVYRSNYLFRRQKLSNDYL